MFVFISLDWWLVQACVFKLCPRLAPQGLRRAGAPGSRLGFKSVSPAAVQHLSVVCQCDYHNPTARGSTVTFLASLNGAQSAAPEAFAEGSVWVATYMERVISQQRIAVSAYLRPSPPFLYRLLGSSPATHTKFGDDDDAPPVVTEASEVVHGPGPVVPGAFLRDSVLNASQHLALEACMKLLHGTGGLELIQGPPGCGKTRFVAQLLQHLVAANGRVLVAAPSNKAVCVALEQFVEARGDDECFGFPVLVGVEDELRLCVKTGFDRYYVSRIIYGMRTQLHDLLAGLGAAWLRCDDEFCTAKHTACMLLISHTGQCNDAHAHLRGCVTTLHAFLQRVSRVWSKSGVRAAKDIVKPKALLAAAHLASDVGEAVDKAVSWPCTRRTSLVGTVKGLRDQVGAILAQLSAADDEACRAAGEELLSFADVVFCTLGSSGNMVIRDMVPVDILVVDEAGQANEGEVLVALNSRPKSCILVGDPQQLPAFTASEDAKAQGYSKSLLQRLMQSCQHRYTLLDTQYRMHPEISQFPAEHFYDGKLQDAAHVKNRPVHHTTLMPALTHHHTHASLDPPPHSCQP